jgi:hypothetical protein
MKKALPRGLFFASGPVEEIIDGLVLVSVYKGYSAAQSDRVGQEQGDEEQHVEHDASCRLF